MPNHFEAFPLNSHLLFLPLAEVNVSMQGAAVEQKRFCVLGKQSAFLLLTADSLSINTAPD